MLCISSKKKNMNINFLCSIFGFLNKWLVKPTENTSHLSRLEITVKQNHCVDRKTLQKQQNHRAVVYCEWNLSRNLPEMVTVTESKRQAKSTFHISTTYCRQTIKNQNIANTVSCVYATEVYSANLFFPMQRLYNIKSLLERRKSFKQ